MPLPCVSAKPRPWEPGSWPPASALPRGTRPTGPGLSVHWEPGEVAVSCGSVGRSSPQHRSDLRHPHRIVLICAKRSLCAAFSVLPYGEGLRVR